MTPLTIYPAIDLREGQVVRLRQGRRADSKIFTLTPQQAAEMWIEQGATWLHVVNLDGAFGEEIQQNLSALQAILSTANGQAKVQFGGGLRSNNMIDEILSLGVHRVIMGTAAVVNPALLAGVLDTYSPERIVLGIDARDGLVQVAGWEQETNLTPIALTSRSLEFGLKTIIYTNIRRDGMGSGVDIEGTQALASATNLDVIASGGVGSLADIRQVKAAGLPGVIIGRALYENKFSLSEAIKC